MKTGKTVITFDHHANIDKMGTFRTYTVRVDANDVLFKNLTIENNAPSWDRPLRSTPKATRYVLSTAVSLEIRTRFSPEAKTRLYFADCYIEGTTDFIFGPATAYFKNCDIFSKRDSYITAASTPGDVRFGYIFDSCKLRAADNVKKVYLGRPWRPYAHTVFINCEMGSHPSRRLAQLEQRRQRTHSPLRRIWLTRPWRSAVRTCRLGDEYHRC